MLNKIFLQGRLVVNPELRQTPAGIYVSTFRIAVDRDFNNKETGEKETDFVNIVAWRNTAEFVCRYFAKGRLIIVEGRLQMRNYTDRDGNKRTATEVVADSIYFGDSKRDYDNSNNSYGGSYAAPDSPAAPASPAPSYGTPAPGGDQFAELSDDGELPF